MSAYQTTPQNLKAVHLGSGKIEIGTSSADAQDLGLAGNISFKEDFTPISLEPDNSVEIIKGIGKHTCKLSFEMWELDPTKLALLRGGIDTVGSTEAAPVSVTNETHTLTGTSIVWLDHANGDGSEVGSVTVKDVGSNAASRNTDYVIVVGTDGRTGIARVAASTVIASGEGVLVNYTYTPSANKTRSTGGLDTFDSRYVRVTNINSQGKKYQLEIYKARITGGLDMSFPADKEGKPITSKIEMEGILDPTRTAGDQLYKETDEQSV